MGVSSSRASQPARPSSPSRALTRRLAGLRRHDDLSRHQARHPAAHADRHRNPLPAHRLLKALFRWYKPISPWAMIDVYLLGFLVAYTRLIGMASVHLDTALFSLIGFMVSMAAADGSLDHETTWRALDHDAAHAPVTAPPGATLHRLPACGLLNHAVPGTALPALPCHAAPAQNQQHQPQLGAAECRGTALHPSQHLPGHGPHPTRPHLSLHHHGRHR